MSVLLVAAFFALLSALVGDFVGAIAGLVIAGSGAMEVHGGTLLNHYDVRGANWLISSQLVCLAGILVYCAVRLFFAPMPPMPDDAKAMLAMSAQQWHTTAERLWVASYQGGLMLFAVLSTAYQGGLAIYYARRRRALAQAVQIED